MGKVVLLFALSLFMPGCSSHNNILLGRVQDVMEGHDVVVTDCYITSVPEPQLGPHPGEFQWRPCRDADVSVRNGKLQVNGVDYGAIGAHDAILVDHGKVSIERRK